MATIEELERIVAEIGIAVRETAEAQKKAAAEAAEAQKKAAAEAAEAQKKAAAEVAEAKKRADAEAAEAKKRADAEAAESKKESDRIDKELKASLDDLSKTVNYWVGRFGNTTGYITEMILLPGIRKKMAGYGHKFDSVAARQEFFRGGRALAEADLILENGKEVMIVEVKTHLTKYDIDDQIERLNRLRKNEKQVRMAGKALISAVAGIRIDKDAKRMAKELGMYIITLVETDKNITVDPPEKVGRW